MPSLCSWLFPASLFLALSFAADDCDCYIDDSKNIWDSRIYFDFSKGDPGDAFHKVFNIFNTRYEGNTVTNQYMTPDNVLFHDGIMELKTNNDGGTQYSAGLLSWTAMQYGSFRIHMAVDGAPGGVAGFFVYRDAKHEQDVEILTADQDDMIHYTNHINPSSGPLAGDNPHLIPSLNASWRQPSFHRFDWLPDWSLFFFNDMHGKPYKLDQGSPDAACTFQINMWSCGKDWGGNMTEGASASMKVGWVEAVFNSTSEQLRSQELRSGSLEPAIEHDGQKQMEKRSGKACARVCKIDGVKVRGVPELVGRGATVGPQA